MNVLDRVFLGSYQRVLRDHNRGRLEISWSYALHGYISSAGAIVAILLAALIWIGVASTYMYDIDFYSLFRKFLREDVVLNFSLFLIIFIGCAYRYLFRKKFETLVRNQIGEDINHITYLNRFGFGLFFIILIGLFAYWNVYDVGIWNPLPQ